MSKPKYVVLESELPEELKEKFKDVKRAWFLYKQTETDSKLFGAGETKKEKVAMFNCTTDAEEFDIWLMKMEKLDEK